MISPRAEINESLTGVEFTWSDGYATELSVAVTTNGSCTLTIDGEDYPVYDSSELIWSYGRSTPVWFESRTTVSQVLYDWFEANTSRDLADTTELTNRVSELENQVVTLATQIMPHVVGTYSFNETMLPPARSFDEDDLNTWTVSIDDGETEFEGQMVNFSVYTDGSCDIYIQGPDESLSLYVNNTLDWSNVTIDFGTKPQMVTSTFYNWLLANTDRVGVIDASEVAM